MKKQGQSNQIRKKIISVSVTMLLVFSTCLCLFVVVQVLSRGYVSLGGKSFFRVVTGSMEPTLAVGELIMTKEVDISEISENDIVSFRSQLTENLGSIITHRVINVLTDENGEILLLTKGDANLSMDGKYVTESNLVGRVVWRSGGTTVSSVLSFISGKYGFLACIVFPSLIILTLVLRENVFAIKRDMKKIVEVLEAEKKEESVSSEAEEAEEDYESMRERIRLELIKEMENYDDAEQPKQ